MQLERMKERYERKLLTKGLTCLWENRKEQLEIKADLTIRHEVNQLKVPIDSFRLYFQSGRELHLRWLWRISIGRGQGPKGLKNFIGCNFY